MLRRPSRYGIAKELVLDLERAAIAPTEALDWLGQEVPPQGLREVLALADHLKALRNLPAPKVISYIRQEIGYDRYIDQYCEWSGSDPREAREVLSALEQIPEAHEDARAYLALAAREAQQDADTEEAPGRITLSSLHGAMGLEWERVWLLSAVEGALPHRYAIESGSQAVMEEERRLFYVGMTRAKDMLMVSAPAHMFGQDARVSRFVQESGIWAPPLPTVLKTVGRRGAAAPAPAAPPLPAEDYAPGVACFHAKFGTGVIDRVAKQAGLVEVLFGGQQKVLDLEVCQAGQVLRVGSRY